MSEALTLLGAFALGLAGSGHCLVMCGGINAALAIATRAGADGRPRFDLLLGYQAGRIGSYVLAALLLGGAGTALGQALDAERVRLVLRGIGAVAIAAVALSLLLRGRGLDMALGHRLWPRLAPLARGLLPVRNLGQALALGALWGWMPCGLAYSMLLVAWLAMDPLQSALTMLAFGLGTAPAVLAGAHGARQSLRLLERRGIRSAAAGLLLASALATAFGPWLAARSDLMHWLPFDCAMP